MPYLDFLSRHTYDSQFLGSSYSLIHDLNIFTYNIVTALVTNL